METDHICFIDDTYCPDCGQLDTQLADPIAAMRSFVDEYAEIFGYVREQ